MILALSQLPSHFDVTLTRATETRQVRPCRSRRGQPIRPKKCNEPETDLADIALRHPQGPQAAAAPPDTNRDALQLPRAGGGSTGGARNVAMSRLLRSLLLARAAVVEIGRASCRERV